MKISKSILDAISEAMSQPTNQHSSRGNYVIESAKSTNPGYGYHGTAPEGSNAAAADKRYAAAHKTVSKITGAGPVVVKHYLDSTHGRHLESREGDHSYIKKDFADFSKKYKPEHFNESLLDRGPDDTDLEDLEETDLSEGTLEKLTLDQLKKRHAEHHESGGGSDRSYKAMEAIEKHVAHKYGPKAIADLHKSTEKHALSGGDGMAVLKKMHEAYNESLQAHELPAHVKDSVKKVHAVLKKHKVMGAHVSVAHHDYEPRHENADGGHHEINIQVGRHHADNDDLIDDLHSTQPVLRRPHRKGDVAICPCASIHPSPRHNLHEEADVVSEAIRPGDTDGRSHTDEHGVTWDDEGHNSAGTGHNDSRPKYSSKTKHYHTVPYKDKEHAKGEGMKWDKDKSKWYHTDAAKSATSKFRKLQEEAELNEGERFDHREAAKKGVIHPHAFVGMKVGSYHDHYSTKNGDKLQFKVHKHTADGVVLQAPKSAEKEHGKYHTYKISHEYDRKLNEEKKVVGHKFSVTTTDPDATAVSKRDYKRHQVIRVGNEADREKAAARAKAFYKKQGLKVHDVIHHSEIHEELDYTYDYGDKVKVNATGKVGVVHQISPTGKYVGIQHPTTKKHIGYHPISDVKKLSEEEEIPVEFELAEGATQEGHATKEAADKAMAVHEKKHPLAKHTVMQGRRSGRWHVVRHTSGGMHVVESKEHPFPNDHDHIAALTSDGEASYMKELHPDHQKKIKAFVKSKHWKDVDKKHTDKHTGEKDAGGHVDDDFDHAFKKWHKETHGTAHKTFKPIHEEVVVEETAAPKMTWKAWLEGKGFPNQEKFEPKTVVKEGDESEAEYQEYLKSLKEKKKKVSTIKTIVRNK